MSGDTLIDQMDKETIEKTKKMRRRIEKSDEKDIWQILIYGPYKNSMSLVSAATQYYATVNCVEELIDAGVIDFQEAREQLHFLVGSIATGWPIHDSIYAEAIFLDITNKYERFERKLAQRMFNYKRKTK